MRISKSVFPLVAGVALLMTSVTAFAQDDGDAGFYLGGSYGVAKVNDSEFDDDNDVPQGFLGIQFNSVLGIEASYIDFGTYGGGLARASTDGYGLALTGTLPLSESFGLYAKVGQFWWDSDVRTLGFRDSYDGSELYYGVGLSFAMTDNLDFRISYDRLDVDLSDDDIGPIINGDFDSQIDILSAGIKLTF